MKCPNCSSSRFKKLIYPEERGEWIILARCLKCKYELGRRKA